MTAKRGRPRKFKGVKDRKTFPAAIEATLPAVVEFIVEWRTLQSLPVERGYDRYQEVLAATAKKYGLSTRTFERRCAELRFLAEPIAEEMLASANPAPIALSIEHIADE